METPERVADLCRRPVGGVVAEDYRRARAFESYGIDFCCGGGQTVREACEAIGVGCDELAGALEAAEQSPEGPVPAHLDPRAWDPAFLADYIEHVHHRYVREQGPRLRRLTRTVAHFHRGTNPGTVRIADRVDELTRVVEGRTETEERELFPYVRALCAAARGGAPAPPRPEGASGASTGAPGRGRSRAGALLREVRALSGGFEAPEAACATFRTAYAELGRFAADLRRHVHLENNVLLPAALRMERALARLA